MKGECELDSEYLTTHAVPARPHPENHRMGRLRKAKIQLSTVELVHEEYDMCM